MKTKKKPDTDVESLDAFDPDEEGFFEGDIDLGSTIAAFNFGGSIEKPKPILAAPLKPETSIFSNSLKGIGMTPAIDGEAFSIKRGYQFRPSTLRKLAELKARHPNVNVYLNTILDEAINHYYNYILNEQGS
jgi:hypothetical protein